MKAPEHLLDLAREESEDTGSSWVVAWAEVAQCWVLRELPLSELSAKQLTHITKP